MTAERWFGVVVAGTVMLFALFAYSLGYSTGKDVVDRDNRHAMIASGGQD